jgi:hypothetical protein
MQLDRAAYYERAYWRKFVALFDSLGNDFRDSNGRLVSAFYRPMEFGPTRPNFFPVAGSPYKRREVRWATGYRGDIRLPEFSHLTGLVSLIEFGGPSQLRFTIRDISGACSLNGVPLTALLMRRIRRGEDRYWTTRLHFQIDCREEVARLDAVRALKRLWRSRKSHLSWLPRELLVCIQSLVLAE